MAELYQQNIKTKYISSGFKGVPTLDNTYGSMNNLLKKVLTEPYNTQNVLSFESGEFLVITLNLNHGFLKDQVVCIKNNENTFNREFRILEASLNTIHILNTEEPLPEDSSLIIEGSPLGYSVIYEDLDKGVLCIKNKSDVTSAILKSIDKLPPNGYNESWSKFSRVVIGQHIDSSGNFIDNVKAPFHPEFPYAEDTGNKVQGEGGTFGFAKWRYSLGQNYEPTENRVPTGIYPTRWRIVGDANTFYLMVHTTGSTETRYSYDLVGYGVFKSYNELETNNVCLQATEGFHSANSNPQYAPTRPRSFFGSLNYNNTGFLLTDVYGSHKTGYNFCKNVGEYLSEDKYNHPWETSTIETINPETGVWNSSRLIIKDHLNYIRGEHRGIQILYGTGKLPDGNITSEGTLSLEVQVPYNTSEFKVMTVLFSLTDWEL